MTINNEMFSEDVINALEQRGIDPDFVAIFQKICCSIEYCHLITDRNNFLMFLEKNMLSILDQFQVQMKNRYGNIEWQKDFSIEPIAGGTLSDLEKTARAGDHINEFWMEHNITFNNCYFVGDEKNLGLYEINIQGMKDVLRSAEKYNLFVKLNPCEIFRAYLEIKDYLTPKSGIYFFSRDDNDKRCKFSFSVDTKGRRRASVSKLNTSLHSYFIDQKAIFLAKPQPLIV